MSKISSKLTAGVRKVKTEQQADKSATPPAASAPAQKPAKNSPQRPAKASDLHPARIWPD